MNGLNLTRDEFIKMPLKQQNTIIFDNTEELKSLIVGFKFQQKIQWYAIVFIAVLGGVVQYFKLL